MLDYVMLQVLDQFPVIQIGVIVLTALLFGVLFSRLGQSSAIGYILAGILLGPVALNYLTAQGTGVATFFGEIGVMMLLFYLGLELNIKRFLESGAVATILAFVEMLFAFVAGFFVAKFFGFSDFESLVVGAMLTATSTVITSKFIMERGLIRNADARVVLAILVLEDFFAILVLVFLSSLGSQQSLNALVLNALVFIVAMFFIVSRVSKHVLNILSRLGYADHMWMYGVGVFLVVAYFGSTYLGLSPALGAYFAGFALAETVYGNKIKEELGLFREFFILFFFVSFGASTPLPDSASALVMLAVLVVSYIVSKILAYVLFGTALGLELESSVNAGILMISVGEFSLIIAAAASQILPNPGRILSLAFMLTISTTMAMPLLYNARDKPLRFMRWLYPRSLIERSRVLDRKLHALDELGRDPKFHGEYVVTVESILKHFIIAVSIVYLAFLSNARFSIPFLPFIPANLSVGVVILPVILWPIYQIITDMIFLVKRVATGVITRTFPAKDENIIEIERQAANVFTGTILTVAGIGATALLYYKFQTDPLFLLVPATFTLIAVMYLSRSFYSLVEEYEEIESDFESMEEGMLIKNKKLVTLSRDFEEHARKLRQLQLGEQSAREDLHEALKAQDMAKAREALKQFRQQETRTMLKLFKYRHESARQRESKRKNAQPPTRREYAKSARGQARKKK